MHGCKHACKQACAHACKREVINSTLAPTSCAAASRQPDPGGGQAPAHVQGARGELRAGGTRLACGLHVLRACACMLVRAQLYFPVVGGHTAGNGSAAPMCAKHSPNSCSKGSYCHRWWLARSQCERHPGTGAHQSFLGPTTPPHKRLCDRRSWPPAPTWSTLPAARARTLRAWPSGAWGSGV